MTEEQKVNIEEQLQKISAQLERIGDILTIVFNGPLNFYNNTVKLTHERDAYKKAFMDYQDKAAQEIKEPDEKKSLE